MSTDKVRSSKLRFKGEKSKKKRKHEGDDEDGSRDSRSKRNRRAAEEDDDAWVLPEEPIHIRGPTFIYHPSDPQPICVTFEHMRNKVVIQTLEHFAAKREEREANDDDDEAIKAKGKGKEKERGLLDETPSDISQVWVVTRIAGATTINIRTGTGEGKFLSCDAHGLVSADSDARGPQEEWTPVILPDGMVAFQNVYEKYLSVDEVAGGARALRGDSEEVRFGERFWVKIQNKYKREAGEEEKKKNLKDGQNGVTKIDEVSTNHTFQAWGAGRSVVSTADKTELKKARNDGRLAEAMLERRAKLKSDRFC